MKTAIGYVRVSTREQAREGISMDVQETAIRAYCRLRGLALAEVIRDPAESTVRPLARRPGGARLAEIVKAGGAEHVIGFKLCRLFRDVLDCRTHVDQWDRDGVAFHLVDLGGQTIDTSTAMGKFALTVLAAAAEMEREKIRENTQAALDYKRARGERVAGRVPYGFRLAATGATTGPGSGRLERHPAEQRVIQRVKGLRTRGWAVRAIARKFNDESVPNRGKRWHPTTVQRLLMREAA